MNIYRENIIENYKHPSNFGVIKKSDLIGFSENVSCGDSLRFYFNLSKGKVKEVKFSGNGCAISIATASLLSEKVKGMAIKDVKNLKKEDVLELLGIELNPNRLKCALISLDAVLRAFENVRN